jgi:hypothetical protein
VEPDDVDGMFGGLWRIGVILVECSVGRSDDGTSMVYVNGTFDGELRIVRRWK